MTKNERIAYMLDHMAREFHGLGNQINEIRRILTEQDYVPKFDNTAPEPYYPLDDEDLKTPTPPIPSPTWKGTPSVTANGNPPKVSPANNNWKDDMTAAINESNRKTIEALKQAAKSAPLPPNSTFIPAIGAGTVCQLLSQSKRTFFYKIISGVDKGAVIAVNKRTNKVTRDGRYTGNSLRKHTEFVAVVSNDQDGKDYVNGIRKAVFNKRKIYRVYKPKGWAGRFCYCNIYFKRQ